MTQRKAKLNPHGWHCRGSVSNSDEHCWTLHYANYSNRAAILLCTRTPVRVIRLLYLIAITTNKFNTSLRDVSVVTLYSQQLKSLSFSINFSRLRDVPLLHTHVVTGSSLIRFPGKDNKQRYCSTGPHTHSTSIVIWHHTRTRPKLSSYVGQGLQNTFIPEEPFLGCLQPVIPLGLLLLTFHLDCRHIN